ncbi:thioredoxin family protein [Chitinophagaceae bacterium LWZ2-11]
MRFIKLLAGLFLILTLQANAQGIPQPADIILKNALAKADKEHKKVFLIFHASWCGWCHKMDNTMNNDTCKSLFNDNYVIAHITVLESKEKKELENPGGEEMLKKYNGDKGGIPFWLIFDPAGNLLADSQIRPAGASISEPGKNVGCPSEKEEVIYFIKVLKETSRLKQDQLDLIQQAFSKK